MTTQEVYELAAGHFLAGRLPQAEFVLQQVLAREPRHADAQHLMGLLCHRYGHTPLGVGFVRRAIEFGPGNAEYYDTLATLLADQDSIDSALTAIRQAIALRPGFPEALYRQGLLLARKGELDQAIESLCCAMSLKPIYAQAEFELARLLKETGHVEDAIRHFRMAATASLDPRMADALLHCVYFDPNSDARRIAQEHAAWNQRFAKPLAAGIRPHGNDRTPGRKLRIGYVSPYFCAHFIGRLLLPLLARHDREQFEIYCYCDVERPDEITRRFDSFDHVWRNTVGISDDDFAAQVRADRIDVLIDLSQHLEANRLLAFAQKPAPVQATYLAYCGTSGLETMDYRLTDASLEVAGDAVYLERPVQLKTYYCYEPPDNAPAAGPLPVLQTGHITFGCLNDFSKVSPPTWSTWRELLRAIEGSTLLVHAPPGGPRDHARSQFASKGIDPQRLEFVDRLPPEQYLAVYNRIDIALDPFPLPGGLTTCDALWMGVPVVSLAGSLGPWRAGLSILSICGLSNLVATTPDQYVQVAAALPSDLPRLAEMRHSLRDRVRNSPLTNALQFARNVEAVYRQWWTDWCGPR
jgi:predicted O-linked N-acetylglucosamine transferase (SPINDLY family)